MSKRDLYHANLNTNKKDFGYLKQESTNEYYKVVNRTNQGFNDNSYYEVLRIENGQAVESEKILSVSSEAVDLGFFTELTEEEFKIQVL